MFRKLESQACAISLLFSVGSVILPKTEELNNTWLVVGHFLPQMLSIELTMQPTAPAFRGREPVLSMSWVPLLFGLTHLLGPPGFATITHLCAPCSLGLFQGDAVLSPLRSLTLDLALSFSSLSLV